MHKCFTLLPLDGCRSTEQKIPYVKQKKKKKKDEIYNFTIQEKYIHFLRENISTN